MRAWGVMLTDSPERYEYWYHTPRGRWVSDVETRLLLRLLRARTGERVLDVGCGTGHFSRRLAVAGLSVTGLDRDAAALEYARRHGDGIVWLHGDARALPFPDGAFDHCVAVTSLCFVDDPARALAEMWRVARRGVVLGLLNRRSLLHRGKAGRGGYRGARWDDVREVRNWIHGLAPRPGAVMVRSAIFLSSGKLPAKALEAVLPNTLPWGGFLAVGLHR